MGNYTKFRYSKKKVDEAATVLISPSSDANSRAEALKIVNNWRSSHSWPMNIIYGALKRYSADISSNLPVVQRLKRMTSIQRKLPLLRKKNLRFSEMQDIGGCRAIVKNVKDVYALAARIKNSQMKHKLEYENDYINDPKIKSGYRGIHLVYGYNSDKSNDYNGHRIEIQLRSRFQHAWATAVETVDTFTDQALKSDKGQKKWKRFFRLMATVMAIRENTPPAKNTPIDNATIKDNLSKCTTQIGVIRSIKETGSILPYIEQDTGAHYFLIVLDSKRRRTSINGFKKSDYKKAVTEYLRIERENTKNTHINAVLVSAETIEMLQKAYTNYFSDMTVFAKVVEEILS